MLEYVHGNVERMFREKEAMVGSEVMRALEKHVMLSVLDNAWKEHLASMDYLRQGIYLRGYAQKQPKQEFKREAFELFQLMLDRVKHEIIQLLARVRIRNEDEVQALEQQQQRQAQARQLQFQHAEAGGLAAGEPEPGAEPNVAMAPQTTGASRSARRSAATIRARADPARNTSTATVSSPDFRRIGSG